MIAISLPGKISRTTLLADWLVEQLKIRLVIKPLQRWVKPKYFEQKLAFMRSLPQDSVGYRLAEMLDQKGLKLSPYFESHDLKHLLLGYGMSSGDEIRMQAYLFGNGNRSVFCMLFLLSGILYPASWSVFYRDYKKGKAAPSILELDLESRLSARFSELKTRVSRSVK